MRFREIVGYEDYLIYDDGSVYSRKSNRFLKPRIRGSRRPYYAVALYNGLGDYKNVSVHRLVAEAFIHTQIISLLLTIKTTTHLIIM